MTQPTDFQTWLFAQSAAIVIALIVIILQYRQNNDLIKSRILITEKITEMNSSVNENNLNNSRLILFIGSAEFVSIVAVVGIIFLINASNSEKLSELTARKLNKN